MAVYTPEERRAAFAAYMGTPRARSLEAAIDAVLRIRDETWRAALAAANRIRDNRIRNEALEEAAQMFEQFGSHGRTTALAVAEAIRALKYKTDEGEASR